MIISQIVRLWSKNSVEKQWYLDYLLVFWEVFWDQLLRAWINPSAYDVIWPWIWMVCWQSWEYLNKHGVIYTIIMVILGVYLVNICNTTWYQAVWSWDVVRLSPFYVQNSRLFWSFWGFWTSLIGVFEIMDHPNVCYITNVFGHNLIKCHEKWCLRKRWLFVCFRVTYS